MNERVRTIAGVLLALLVASFVGWVVLSQRDAEGTVVSRLQRDLGFEAEVQKSHFRDPALVVTRVSDGGLFAAGGVRPGFAFVNTTDSTGVRKLYEYLESRRGQTAQLELLDFSGCGADCIPKAHIAKVPVPR